MSDATRPLVSVVIPTRDRVESLRRVLDRLAAGRQTLGADRYEVVVSDDGVPQSAARGIADTHPWVRVIEGPRRGPAANRNHAARAARGEWIVFTDDDTEPSPDWLSALLSAIEPSVEAYEGRTTCNGGFRSPMFHAPVNETGGRFWSCNIMVSAAAFRRVSGFDEAFRFPHMEDQDLRVRLGARGRIGFVPDAVVNHPPRRQPSGARLGAYREAEVRYLYKHGAPRPVAAKLLENVVRYRLGVIRSTPKSVDTLLALWSLASEFAWVLAHVRRWERASAREFPGAAGAA